MIYYAGIGSRKTPIETLRLMSQIAKELGTKGYVLRSGRAEGADQYFELGAEWARPGKVGTKNELINTITESKGGREIMLPWDGFGYARHDGNSYFSLEGLESSTVEIARSIAEHHHPNWRACSAGAKKLHTRNVFQILGPRLDTPVKFVVCWAEPDPAAGPGMVKGGTGLAVRVALKAQVPVFNLQQNGELERLITYVDSLT